ncbi:MAG: hypothetical protein IH908_00670, partial [Proteobacteria bacterium]|nr:hypothetical protein [Pseudomonadota bacterium]
MGTGREHFALDWIKGELLETLNESRQALEAYAESNRDETRMRVCLTCLHQVHGTLIMLELQGVTLLADHLERLAQNLLDCNPDDHSGNEAAARQSLMQGILELPGYLEEIQRGATDSRQPMLPLVNEIRDLLGEEPIESTQKFIDISADASTSALDRFESINGIEHLVVLERLHTGRYREVSVTPLRVRVSIARISATSRVNWFARQWSQA